jgi:hypothetical protein
MRDGKRMMADLDRDIREHIEIETQDNIGRGMSPEEARHAAMRKFGNVKRVKDGGCCPRRVAALQTAL